jgi:hypothetical protein
VVKYGPAGNRLRTWSYNSGLDDEAVGFVLDDRVLTHVVIFAACDAGGVPKVLRFDDTQTGPVWLHEYTGGYAGMGRRITDIALQWHSDSGAYGVAVTGEGRYDENCRRTDYLTVSYHAWGTKRWHDWLDGHQAGGNNPLVNYDDSARAIACDRYGNVFVTGMANQKVDGTDWVYYTKKYNFNHESRLLGEWSDSVNTAVDADDDAIDIAVYEPYYVYVTGSYEHEAPSDWDDNYNVHTVRYYYREYDPIEPRKSGWFAEESYEDEDHDETPVELNAGDNGVYLAVRREDDDNDAVYFQTIKYDINLDYEWGDNSLWYAGSAPEECGPRGIAVDYRGNAYVAGNLEQRAGDALGLMYQVNGTLMDNWDYDGELTPPEFDEAADVAVYSVPGQTNPYYLVAGTTTTDGTGVECGCPHHSARCAAAGALGMDGGTPDAFVTVRQGGEGRRVAYI